jgi:MerR family transcriptional regulator, copper efflux regulator
MRSSDELSIGELARRFGLATHVLRHWESVGLLAPVRDAAGQRRYGPADLDRVAMILMGKEVGFGLRDLTVLVTAPDPMRHSDLLRERIAELDRRIAAARSAKAFLEHALDCPLSFAECPHATERIAARIPPA